MDQQITGVIVNRATNKLKVNLYIKLKNRKIGFF